MAPEQLVEYSSYVIAVVGLFGTFYYGIKSTRLEKKLRTISWTDIDHGVEIISRKIKNTTLPEVILTMSIPGRIVSSLMLIRHLKPIEEHHAIALSQDFHLDAGRYILVQTNKFKIGIPRTIENSKEKKLLILDSAVVTGDVLSQTIATLETAGFSRRNITTASLIATEFSIESQKGPDFHWLTIKDGHYSLPWGNLSIPWY